jgi:FMN phosphatase YigB (HAD superfamily)
MAGCYKPDAAIFRHALQKAGVQPYEAVHIGDIPEVDVAGAQGAGLRGVWFNPSANEVTSAVKPDATVRDFSELPALLAGWRA